MATSKVNNKKILKNTTSLYIRMFVIMIVNFYTSRVILDVLGVKDYGIYNVVGSIVIIFSFLKTALSDASLRFLNYEMGIDSGYDKLRKVFSTSLNCYLLLSIIIFLVGEIVWLIWGSTLNIPVARRYAANIVFQFSLFTFILGIYQVPYNACIIAYERMGFYALISILETILKLLLIFCISYIFIDKLILFSMLMCLNSAIILICYIIFCKNKFKITRYQYVYDKKMLNGILSYTSWSLLGNITGVCAESGVSILFNIFTNVAINASIGLVNNVNNAVMGFVSGFQTAFKPQIIKSYASNEIKNYHKLIFRSSKFSFFLFFLVSMPLIVYSDTILDIWLVKVPQYASSFCRIILLCSLIDATSGVFFISIGATGNIKKYQICISLIFLLHFLVTYLLLFLGLDYNLVFFSRIITRGLINMIIGVYFIKRLTGMSIQDYIMNSLLPILKGSIIPTILILILFKYLSHSIVSMIICVLLFEVISFFCIYFLSLDNSEKNFIQNFIKKGLKKCYIY